MNGITGSSLKKDNVVKHSKSGTHTSSVNMSKNPKMTDEIFGRTPIGRALSH